MSVTSRKRSTVWRIVLISFVILGLSGLAIMLFSRSTHESIQSQAIRTVLARNGVPEQTIKYWIAVSAFETNGWTSQVFKDSNNLFNLIVPGSKTLSYGEGQTIYPSLEQAAQALVDKVIKPFNYPLFFPSLQSLTDFMDSKNYYTSDPNQYYNGTLTWYNKLFA